MSGYVPNNRNAKTPPAPSPYNGDFDQQTPRSPAGSPRSSPECLVGIRFIWDNNEALPTSIPYLLTTDQGACLQGGLDARGSLVQTLPQGAYEAQLLANIDVDSAVTQARAELQTALDEILAAELAVAERLQQEQEGRSPLSNYFHTAYAFGKGFFLGAFGLVKTIKEMDDLSSPHNLAWNLLASAWNAKAGPGETWTASYLRNFAQEQHEDLVEALGFDPASITREQLAEAYEIACFIVEDEASRAILERFAVDYAKAQNVEEIAELGGGGVFEIVLMAVLAVFTGGVGAVARGAITLRHAVSLKRLGTALQRLSQALKHAKIKLKGRARGKGTEVQTVVLHRPANIPPASIALVRDWTHLTLSERHFPHRVTIPKKTGNTMYTVPPEVITKDLQEIHKLGDNIRTGETFKTSSDRVFGIHEDSIHPISGPGTINITSAEYNILVTARKKGMGNARKSLDVMTQKGIFTNEQYSRTRQLLDLMSTRGIK